MSEGEKKSIENLANILTELPDFEKGRLLGYGERIADGEADRRQRRRG